MVGESGDRKPGPQDILVGLYESIASEGERWGPRTSPGRGRRRREAEGWRGRAGDGGARAVERVFKLRNASPSRPSRAHSVPL